ncbi:MAG: hypothetical protein JHC26_06995 [Thermofilum sp.]|uniref:hypothetical protein n=1 Tax=Thermofilum sp. TaxID=1961369 RepID=UPI00259030EB|nr:hypothetical protein [Thermofilum sp.]MCI4408822.1 hypothetical protein [Thermofilum sp.]
MAKDTSEDISMYSDVLNELHKKLKSGKFSVRDAERLAEVKRAIKTHEKIPESLYEKYIDVYGEFLERLAEPSYSSSLAVLVLGILHEAKRPLTYEEVKRRVEKVLGHRLDDDSELWLRLELESLSTPLNGVPLVSKKGIFSTRYGLTKEGKIVAVFRRDDYEELKKNRGFYERP